MKIEVLPEDIEAANKSRQEAAERKDRQMFEKGWLSTRQCPVNRAFLRCSGMENAATGYSSATLWNGDEYSGEKKVIMLSRVVHDIIRHWDLTAEMDPFGFEA